jgi:hypothetical protein
MEMRQSSYTIVLLLTLSCVGTVASQSHQTPDRTLSRQFDMRDWQTYRSKEYRVQFRFPAHWKKLPNEESRFGDTDGLIAISSMGGFGSVEDACSGGAKHKLMPYGSHPKIRKLTVAGMPACVVVPSADQQRSAGNFAEAMVAVQYPAPVRIKNDFYWQLIIFGDESHLLAIAKTIRFVENRKSVKPPDVSKFMPAGALGGGEVDFDFENDEVPEVAFEYLTGGNTPEEPQNLTVKVLSVSSIGDWSEAFSEVIQDVPRNGIPLFAPVTSIDGRQGLLVTSSTSEQGSRAVSSWFVIAKIRDRIVKLEPPNDRAAALKSKGYENQIAQAVTPKDDCVMEEFAGSTDQKILTAWRKPTLVLKYQFTGSSLRLVSGERSKRKASK